MHEHPPISYSPPDSAGQATLSTQINIATRKQHTELNRLITSRLPLGLPPHQKTPLVLSRGLVPFARIILLFEIEWEILARHVEFNLSLPAATNLRAQEIRTWLTGLRPAGLLRTPRIQQDLHHLSSRASHHVYDTVPLGDAWTEEMRALVRQKPHLLVGFAWVFYMAIFSGGRWIRQQLANTVPEFWTGRDGGDGHDQLSTKFPGFTFFSFDGEADGEDVKAAFKARLLEAETLLSEQERKEVVEMSVELFRRSIQLVGEIDRMFVREKAVAVGKSMLPSVAGLILLLGVLIAWFTRR
jgi:heme oxygenase